MTVPEGASEFLLYRTEDGRARIHVRLDGDTVWLTQAALAELYQTTPQNITLHITAIYAEGELDEAATCKDYLQVRQEGVRRVQRSLKHYSLPMILAIGYRVRSPRGVQFRQWATAHLTEYIVKGFTLDDQRLKNPPGPGVPDYFDELLARIRDIRASEKLFYRKVLDIYATSIDYDPTLEISLTFFKTVQNKMHWAITGQTAAEIVHARADAEKPNMGLTSWRGAKVRKQDVGIAKNYLTEDELRALNNLAEQYLIFAEGQAMRRIPMHMSDWIKKLDAFLNINDRDILTHAGKISHDMALLRAEREYEQFHLRRLEAQSHVDSDFDRLTKQLTDGKRDKKP